MGCQHGFARDSRLRQQQTCSVPGAPIGARGDAKGETVGPSPVRSCPIFGSSRSPGRQTGRHSPLRSGDQRRDLSHRQGPLPAQGRGSRQPGRWTRALDARQRRLLVARARFHALPWDPRSDSPPGAIAISHEPARLRERMIAAPGHWPWSSSRAMEGDVPAPAWLATYAVRRAFAENV
jgi:hypothetical protein